MTEDEAVEELDVLLPQVRGGPEEISVRLRRTEACLRRGQLDVADAELDVADAELDVIEYAGLGLLGALLAVPATGAAATLDELAVARMVADPDCEKSTVSIEIDVATGNVYLVDPVTGNLTLTDNEITVSFGELGDVLIKLHYTSSNWNVIVTPDSNPPTVYTTTNGWLRYAISSEVDEYVFSSVEFSSGSSASAMVNMTPVVPDIIILPRKDCPPPA